MRKGTFRKGFIKTTYNQKKKHYTQFSEEEFNYLENKIKNITTVYPSWHLVEKEDILVKRKDILKVLKDSNIKELIIEYNVTGNKPKKDKRVLLRSRDEYLVESNEGTVKCNLCFVISILKNEIITAYYNNINDNHSSINWERYDKNLKIV